MFVQCFCLYIYGWHRKRDSSAASFIGVSERQCKLHAEGLRNKVSHPCIYYRTFSKKVYRI